jgi:hypothetical protein
VSDWRPTRPVCRKDCGESGCVYFRANRCAIDAFKPEKPPARVKGGDSRARRGGVKKVEVAIVEGAEGEGELDQTPTGEEVEES